MRRKIAILGSGAFGIALAIHFSRRKDYDVKLWVHSRATMDLANTRHITKKYPTITLRKDLFISTDVRQVLHGSEIIISAISSNFLREFLHNAAGIWPKEIIVISVTKGMELNTLMRMTEIIKEELRIPNEKIAVLSGPNLAHEIAQGKSATTVIASNNKATLDICQKYIHMEPYFRVYSSNDVLGVELSGAAKNVIAIAAGICDSKPERIGENERASLLVRGAKEIKRLCFKLGSDPELFSDLACHGDIFVTCSSTESRNYKYGREIGAECDPDVAATRISGIAEGINTARVLRKLSEIHEVRMPISKAVYDVITKQTNVNEAINTLLRSGGKAEYD